MMNQFSQIPYVLVKLRRLDVFQKSDIVIDIGRLVQW